jgi:hypothetical protein
MNPDGYQPLPRYSTPIYQVIIESSTIMKYKQFIYIYQTTLEVIHHRVILFIDNGTIQLTLHTLLPKLCKDEHLLLPPRFSFCPLRLHS